MVPQIQLTDFLIAEENIEYIVERCRAKSHILSPERLAYTILSVMVRNLAVLLHLADIVVRPILDRGQDFGKRSCTHLVASSGHLHFQRFVRTFTIVNLTPCLKALLALFQSHTRAILQKLRLQGLVKSFFFAKCLWMR